MLIRPLKPVDAQTYRSLMLAAYSAHPDVFTSTTHEREQKPLVWWQARLSDAPQPHSVVLGAHDDQGKLCAVVGVSFKSQEKTRHKATLFGLYVVEAHRGQGLARKLVEQALLLASNRSGIKLMQLTVSETNPAAIALYQSCGFKQFGIEPMAIAFNSHYLSKIHMSCVIG
ncbi:GNAT family N-acetyltransferase [Pseudomonas sp.]|uniref:GNAT family N-acetyltransferase n=1 Tax=Pseudomonas sp. TaxID=306 RepID=UPI003A97DE43